MTDEALHFDDQAAVPHGEVLKRDMKALRELADSVGVMHLALELLRAEHDALVVTVATQAPAVSPPAKPPAKPPVKPAVGLDPAMFAWRTLDDRAARRSWITLLDWVGWFIARFGLTEQIPPCWTHPDHGALIEELGALCIGWHGAYAPAAKAESAIKWMESLARAQARWREWDHMRCRTAGSHQAPMPPTRAWHGADAAHLEHARADVAARTWRHRHVVLPAPIPGAPS